MTDTKKTQLTVGAKEIINDAKAILDDLANFTGYDELFSIESAIDRIIRKADTMKEITFRAYDDLEEE